MSKTWAVTLKNDDELALIFIVRCTTAHEAWSATAGRLPGSPSFAEVRCVCLQQDLLASAEVRTG